MADDRMLEVSECGGVTVIRLRVHEIGETMLERWTRELGTIVEQPERQRVVIDLEGVSFLTSTTIGALIAAQKKARAHDVPMTLCNLHPNIQQLFAITRVDQLFDIRPSLEDALGNPS